MLLVVGASSMKGCSWHSGRKFPAKNKAVPNNSNRPLFQELGKPVQLLDTQYRMHPDISAFPRKEFYGGKVSHVGIRDSLFHWFATLEWEREWGISVWHASSMRSIGKAWRRGARLKVLMLLKVPKLWVEVGSSERGNASWKVVRMWGTCAQWMRSCLWGVYVDP